MRYGIPLTATAALLFNLALARPAAADDSVTLTTVKKLFKDEPYSAHLFHAGRLWIGEDWSPDEQYPRMTTYSADGATKLGEVRLPHSPSYVYPFGPTAVVVVGKSDVTEWLTHFTVIDTAGGLTASTTTLPSSYQVDRFGGDPDHLYFTEPGDSRVYQFDNGDVRALAPTVAAPEQLAYTSGALFVIKQPNILELGHENVLKIDLASEVATPAFPTPRNGLVDLISLDGGARLATSEYLAGQVLLIDAATNAMTHAVAVHGHPFGLAQLGQCLIAVTDDTKKLEFIDLKAATPAVFAEWDLGSVGLTLKQPRAVTVDQSSGRIFIRSTYICPSCNDTESSVVMAEQASRTVFKHCSGGL